MQNENIFTIAIDRLAFGGAGVGRRDGKVVFIHGAYPGDIVVARVKSDKKRFTEASLVKVETPSPQRRPTPCPYSIDCGGCPWIELEYATQLEWKQKIVEDQFKRIGKIDISVPSVSPAMNELAYRSRIRLKVLSTGGKVIIGYYRHKSHDIVSIERCAVACDTVNRMLTEILEVMNGDPKNSGKVKEIEFEADAEKGRGRVTFYLVEPVTDGFIERVISSCPTIQGVSIRLGKTVKAHGDCELEAPSVGGDTLRFAPGVFSQVNPEQSVKLAEKVTKLANLKPGESGLDLFCGMGTFSLPLAKTGAAVTGIDSNKKAIINAEENRQKLGVVTAHFTHGSALEDGRELLANGLKFDAVILDPPRGGVAKDIETVGELARKRIVYVSCDPPSAARDAAKLSQAGFKLQSVTPFDMFPQTAHIELALLFERV